MVKITPPKDTDGKGKFISLFLYMLHSQTSLILTPKGQSKVSVLERCPYKKGHYDDVTFMTPLTVLKRKALWLYGR